MKPSVERKLTTILCADVSGYTRLMERDEVATLATLRLYRDAMDGLIARHRGRIVSTAGDGLLAEFPSVIEAVQCAIEVQQELVGRNSALPDAQRMAFRIGINLGDVMLHGDDLYGDGVNIAARLQAMAEPGGICISRTVHDQVRNKLAVGFEFLGDRPVKNISEPVPVYAVRLDGGAKGKAERPQAARPKHDRASGQSQRLHRFRARALRGGLLVAGLLVINLLSSPGTWWFVWPTTAIGLLVGWEALRAYFPDTPDPGPQG